MSEDVWLVVGSTPDQPSRVLESFIDQEEADFFLLSGLLEAFKGEGGKVEAGGTVSLIMSRAAKPEFGEHPVSSGSFVINNPGGERHVWDFHTRPCEAREHE